MKTIGLIGGTTWLSTVDYYRIINEKVNKRLGNNASAKILLYSVNFEEIAGFTKQHNWKAIENIIGTAAKNLQRAGADCMLLCANTMHLIAPEIQAAIDIPLLHIAGVVATAINAKKLDTILLLGTKYTMQSNFYPERLQQSGSRVIVPNLEEMEIINESIYNELGKGLLLPETKKMYLAIIEKYTVAGAKGVILGCTEIPLLIRQEDCNIPIFDTTLLHATAAADFALG